ncbi:hypothetical protein FOZ63_022951, partial [Perkinsus olseni]
QLTDVEEVGDTLEGAFKSWKRTANGPETRQQLSGILSWAEDPSSVSEARGTVLWAREYLSHLGVSLGELLIHTVGGGGDDDLVHHTLYVPFPPQCRHRCIALQICVV